MRIDKTDPRFSEYVVLLNGRPIQAVEADDEEGWVDIIDISALAPLLNDSSDVDPEELEPTPAAEIPLKRLMGQVEIRQTTPQNKSSY